MADKEANVKIKATTEGREQIEQMSKQMDALGQQVVKTSETFGSLLKKDLWAAFKTELGSAITEANRFAFVFGEKSTAAIEGMRRASGGLISSVDLMRARIALTSGDFKLTEDQLNAVAAAAVKFSRFWKVDLAESLITVRSAAMGGEGLPKVLQALGSSATVAGTAAEKSAMMLAILQDKTEGLQIKARNASEQVAAAKNSLSQYYGETLIAIKQTEIFKDVTSGLGSAFKDLSLMLRQASSDSNVLAAQFRAIATAMNLVGADGEVMQRLANVIATTGVTTKKVQPGFGEFGEDETSKGKKLTFSPMLIERTKQSGGGARKGSSIDPRGLGLDFSDEALTDIERFEKMTKLASDMAKADEEARKLAASLAEEIENSQRMQQYVEPEIRKNVIVLDRWQTAIAGIGDSFTDLARGGFSEFTQGLTEVAAASILAGDGFAAGMGKMLGATLTGVGRMAAAKAAFYWWEAIASVFLAPAAAPSLFAAAIGMSTLALGLQVAGGALSGVGSGGGGAASGRGMAIAQDTELNQGFRPSSSAASQRNDTRPIVVNVVFDRSDPSAEAFANRRFRQIVTDP